MPVLRSFTRGRIAGRLFTAPNLLAVGTLLIGLLLRASGDFTLLSDRRDGYPPYAEPVLLAVAFGLQISARRYPAAIFGVFSVLVIADMAVGPALPLWIAYSDVVYLAMVRGSQRLQQIVTSVTVVGSVVAAVAGGVVAGPRGGVFAGLVAVAFLLSPVGYAKAVLATRHAAAVENAAVRAEAAAARATDLADERRRVSRELHDTVAGHVSAIAILAEAAGDAGRPGPIVESIRANSLRALDELRAMIDLLATDGDDTATVRWAGLKPLIEAANAVGSTVTMHGEELVADLTHETEVALSRIVGEALANATRHSPGHPVTVTLRRDDDALELRVDNPMGPNVSVGEGRGLDNMRVRAESVGGRVTIDTSNEHWSVTAELPLPRRGDTRQVTDDG